MENQENPKYTELKEHLKNMLKTARRLGLVVEPNGGYTMGYDINNLPPYAVGLFGALSIIEGPAARCKLGLTFNDTESLEAGFNGRTPHSLGKKRFKLNRELMNIGFELRQLMPAPRLRRPSASKWDVFADDGPVAAAPAMPAPAATPDGNAGAVQIGNAAPPAAAPAVAYQYHVEVPHAAPAKAKNPFGEVKLEKKLTKKQAGVASKKAAKNAAKKAEKDKLLAKLAEGLEAKAAQVAPADGAFEAALEKALDNAEAAMDAAEAEIAAAKPIGAVQDAPKDVLAKKIAQLTKIIAESPKIQNEIYGEPGEYISEYISYDEPQDLLDEWYPAEQEAVEEIKPVNVKLPHDLKFIKIDMEVHPANPEGEQPL